MPLLIYSLYRVLLIFGAAGLLYLAGARDLTLVALAVIVGMLVAFLLLRGPRDAATAYLADRKLRRAETGERFSPGIEADADAEDSQHFEG